MSETREPQAAYPDDAVVCGNCGQPLVAHPAPERPCPPKYRTRFRATEHAGKCMGCELVAVVDGCCVECGASEEAP